MVPIERKMGIHLVGRPGTGKSTWMGRTIILTDALSDIPMLVIDPIGGVIDNFFDEIGYRSAEYRQSVYDRLDYYDMSGKSGFVGQFPLYYRLEGDTLRGAAYRFLDVIRKLDPQLGNAPVWGWNPFEKVGVNVGMVLTALELPITAAPKLLADPEGWVATLQELRSKVPEAAPAVDYFLHEYIPTRPEDRKRDTSTFSIKIQQFTHDPVNQTMFSGKPSIDWARVVNEKRIVILDFRGEVDPRFKIMWALSGFLEFVVKRGPNRDAPISVLIDELSFLLSLNSYGNDLLSDFIDDLVNRISRNNNLLLTLAHQEMYQIPDKLKPTLMGMGAQVIGSTNDKETIREYTIHFGHYDPYKVKQANPRFMKWLQTGEQLQFMSRDDQIEEQSKLFKDLPRGQFFVAAVEGEGDSRRNYDSLDVSYLFKEMDQDWVSKVRSWAIVNSGVKVEAPRPEEPAAPTFQPRPRYGTKPGINTGPS
jgi:hypothetical protein